MPRGQYDRAAAAAKREAKKKAEEQTRALPEEVFVHQIKEGEFFVYQKCLWLRLRDGDLFGSNVKRYNLCSNEQGMFCCSKPGTDGKEHNDEMIRLLPDNTTVHRLKLDW